MRGGGRGGSAVGAYSRTLFPARVLDLVPILPAISQHVLLFFVLILIFVLIVFFFFFLLFFSFFC
jgi:hypothetical protein